MEEYEARSGEELEPDQHGDEVAVRQQMVSRSMRVESVPSMRNQANMQERKKETSTSMSLSNQQGKAGHVQESTEDTEQQQCLATNLSKKLSKFAAGWTVSQLVFHQTWLEVYPHSESNRGTVGNLRPDGDSFFIKRTYPGGITLELIDLSAHGSCAREGERKWLQSTRPD